MIYKTKYPELADHLYKMQHRQLPTGWDRDRPKFPADPKGMAGRDASGKILNALAKNVPWLIGGSADFAPSTKTRLPFDGAGDFTSENRSGRNLYFGVREHAMGSILNGLSLSKVRPYGSSSKSHVRRCAMQSIAPVCSTVRAGRIPWVTTKRRM
jgi:transketolase